MKLKTTPIVSIYNDFDFDFNVSKSIYGEYHCSLVVTHKDLPIIFAEAYNGLAQKEHHVMAQELMLIVMKSIELTSRYGKSGLPVSVSNDMKGLIYFPEYDHVKNKWFVLNHEGFRCYSYKELSEVPIVTKEETYDKNKTTNKLMVELGKSGTDLNSTTVNPMANNNK